MKPVEGRWIRPLLCVTRREIEDWLDERGISYRVDETNLEDTYTRNRIRNHVLPYLEANVNARSVEHMTDTMEQMRQLDAFVEEETDRYLRQCSRRGGRDAGAADEAPGGAAGEAPAGADNGTLLILKEEYDRVPRALQSYVLHRALCETAGARQDIGAVHVQALEDLMENQPGRRITLPYGVSAARVYEGIELSRAGGEACGPAANETDTEKSPAGVERIPAGGSAQAEADGAPEGLFRMRIFDRPDPLPVFPTDPYTKWFDYDIINNAVKLRHRRPGDFLAIDRDGHTQKLKQFFINEKIPAGQREEIWLAADGDQIMWVVGYRQNQAYQVTDRTRRILEIVYEKGEGNG